MKKVLIATAFVFGSSAFAQTTKTLACYKAVNPQDVTINAYEDVERDGRVYVENKLAEQATSLQIKVLLATSDYGTTKQQALLAKSKSMKFEIIGVNHKSNKVGIDCDGGGWNFSTDAKTGNMTVTQLGARGIVTMTSSDEGCSDGLVFAKAPIKMVKVRCTK